MECALVTCFSFPQILKGRNTETFISPRCSVTFAESGRDTRLPRREQLPFSSRCYTFTESKTGCVLLSSLVLEGGNTAAVNSKQAAAGELSKESLKKRVFMQESDASNFFKKRSKRFTKSRDELNENRQMLAADEQRREYYEEQRNEFENFVEEERDEQDERSREQIEQWREYHYDGLYPSYQYNRHIV
ncbi:unique cartilage matrix-associated protein isoform X2 [Hemicordylus capensis]|uniref:unique cartilage matrix-associated protein isoform X2 n=1 Tax=Hemicordylus capensis TaxID=884348 RepID=UPI002302CF79|nr:unique cartilage matrix-associated protein isoform X2 [Hemicordylus capensis]